MAKHSSYERNRRAAESTRMVEVQRAWEASVPAPVAAEFARAVAASLARPRQVMPDMAPGTLPRPPRPGRAPKPPKEESSSRSRY